MLANPQRSQSWYSLGRYSEPNTHDKPLHQRYYQPSFQLLAISISFSLLVMATRTLNDGYSTYGSKSHALDVIQVLDDSLPGASAVHPISGVASRIGRPARERKPISQNLVNRL